MARGVGQGGLEQVNNSYHRWINKSRDSIHLQVVSRILIPTVRHTFHDRRIDTIFSKRDFLCFFFFPFASSIDVYPWFYFFETNLFTRAFYRDFTVRNQTSNRVRCAAIREKVRSFRLCKSRSNEFSIEARLIAHHPNSVISSRE